MTAIFVFWMIYKAMKNNNEYKEWLDFHPFKILLLLVFTSIVDWVFIVQGIKYLLIN